MLSVKVLRKNPFNVYPVRNNAPLLCSGVVGYISE